MVTVTFLPSVQGYQEERVEEIVRRLREDHPEWTVAVLSKDEAKPILTKFKLQFGPGILVDGRVEFVGIPRYRMLVERVAMIAAGKVSPRTAAPPAAPAAPAQPAARPAAPAPSSPPE